MRESVTAAEAHRQYQETVSAFRRWIPDPTPVSYTHLDVYKRQAQGFGFTNCSRFSRNFVITFPPDVVFYSWIKDPKCFPPFSGWRSPLDPPSGPRSRTPGPAGSGLILGPVHLTFCALRFTATRPGHRSAPGGLSLIHI